MRKYIQHELIKIIETIEQANDILNNLVKTKNDSQILEILTNIQQSIIQIGNTVENSEGMGTKSVSMLEQYCELVYLCTQAGIADEKRKIIIQMDELLIQVKKEVKSIPIEYEIVFMPYKASMWDCLESIWMAACENENCRCFVIPIPYYDKNKDGTMGALHYEGDKFPDNIPITNYYDYNLKDRQPDIIYIHNPNDQFNKVTSVHEDYYSFNLKKHTKMLVYVPYFITERHLPEIHFLLPVYYYADRIVLQNEFMIEDIDDRFPKEKFIALGSPKIDKLLKLCGSLTEFPDKWEKYVYRDDGVRKKVIMYNVSISGMLQKKERMLEKMKYVFNVAKKTEGIVLLWRPHPLMESTIESMEQELREEYIRLKNIFIDEQIGIYDDTPDPATSIALSDAYIGELSSSIVTMFGVAGKPILILDENITDESEIVTDEEMSALSFIDMVIDGDSAWFVNNRYQAICKMSLKTGETQIVAMIPETNIALINLYSHIYKKGNKLYLTPLHTAALCIYNIDENTFQKIYFPNTKINNFSGMLIRGNEIILLPCGYEGLVRYNLSKEKSTYIDGFIQEHDRLCSDFKRSVARFSSNYRELEGYLWILCVQCNYVIRYKLEDNTWKFYEVGKKSNSYRDISYDGKYMWLLPFYEGNIIRWDIRTGKTDEIVCSTSHETNKQLQMFKWWYKCEDKLYAIPIRAESILEVDTQNIRVSEISIGTRYGLQERKFEHWKGYGAFDCVKRNGDNAVLKSTYDESILVVDFKDKKVKAEIPVRLKINDLNKIKDYIYSKELKERGSFFGAYENKEGSSIQLFFSEIINMNVDKSNEQVQFYETLSNNINGECGKAINSFIMNEVKTIKKCMV